MNFVHYIGLLAGALTSGAALPQVWRTWRTRHARDISMWQLVLLSTGMLLWLIYGLLIDDLPLIAANTFSICCYVGLICMKIRFDREDAGAVTRGGERPLAEKEFKNVN